VKHTIALSITVTILVIIICFTFLCLYCMTICNILLKFCFLFIVNVLAKWQLFLLKLKAELVYES